MKAFQFSSFGGPETLDLVDVATPEPRQDEVQIKIHYASVNPVDWKIREGMLQDILPHELPIIPGWDAAGIVTKTGKDVSRFREGDAVFAYCRKPVVKQGTYAEYITFREADVAPKPENLSFAEAAAIPLCGLTAWQALYDVGRLQKGETILIGAGAGGVGSLAIQLAKQIGAKIYTTASSNHHSYVRELGADAAIDYNKEDFVEAVRKEEPDGVDFVFDCVGGESQKKSLDLVKKGGRIVTIVQKIPSEEAEKRGIKAGLVFVRPNGEQLEKIGKLLEEGKIAPPHITELPFEEAVAAQKKNAEGHTEGKIVLKIISSG